MPQTIVGPVSMMHLGNVVSLCFKSNEAAAKFFATTIVRPAHDNGLYVRDTKAVSGKTVYEVAHGPQTISEPFLTYEEAHSYLIHLTAAKGTDSDPLRDFWARVEAG